VEKTRYSPGIVKIREDFDNTDPHLPVRLIESSDQFFNGLIPFEPFKSGRGLDLHGIITMTEEGNKTIYVTLLFELPDIS